MLLCSSIGSSHSLCFFISVSQLTGQHRWCILPLRHTHNTPTPVSTYQSGASAHFVRTIHNTWHVKGKNRRSLRMSRTSQKRQWLLTNITGSRGASGLLPVKAAAPDNDCKVRPWSLWAKKWHILPLKNGRFEKWNTLNQFSTLWGITARPLVELEWYDQQGMAAVS